MGVSKFDQPKAFPYFDVHHWADWVELCCLEDLDGTASREDMEKRFERSTECDACFGDPVIDGHGTEEAVMVKDKTTELIAEWFAHLRGRVAHFGVNYPFSLSNEDSSLSLSESPTSAQRLYLLLLAMANLHYFDEFTSGLTSDFERLCAEALTNLLPANAHVHVFGKGGSASARYTGNAFERIRRLADDLGAHLLVTPESLPPQSTGDAGLDLVAWLPWQDRGSHTLSVFAQCACTPEWRSKQHSSNPTTWCCNKFSLQCMPVNAVFTPYFLRKNDGAWGRPMDMGPYVFIDRLRLTALLANKAHKCNGFSSFSYLDRWLNEKADPS